MLSLYIPIVIMLIVAGGFAITTATLMTDKIGPRRFNRAKLDAYECGIQPTPLPPGSSGRFPIKFYLTAMLFIVFDIEIVFLYPLGPVCRSPSAFSDSSRWACSSSPCRRLCVRLASRRARLGLTGSDPDAVGRLARNNKHGNRKESPWASRRSFPAASC